MNKAANTVKITRVFRSCKTYEQWNAAFDWFKKLDREIYLQSTLDMIHTIFNETRLKI